MKNKKARKLWKVSLLAALMIILFSIIVYALSTSATITIKRPDGTTFKSAVAMSCPAVSCGLDISTLFDARCGSAGSTANRGNTTCTLNLTATGNYECAQEGWYKAVVTFSHSGTNCDGTSIDSCSSSETIPEQNLYFCDLTKPSINLIANPISSACTGDPTIQWVDCRAIASIKCNDPLSGGGSSGCNPSAFRYKTYSSNPGSCPTDKNLYTIGDSVEILTRTWVCGYVEDNQGNYDVSSPVEILVNRTFTFNVTAKAYDDKGYVMKNEPVSVYLCNNDVVFCNSDAQYITSGSTVSNNQGWFTVVIAAVLDKGIDYKIGVVTSKGYAEAVVRT